MRISKTKIGVPVGGSFAAFKPLVRRTETEIARTHARMVVEFKECADEYKVAYEERPQRNGFSHFKWRVAAPVVGDEIGVSVQCESYGVSVDAELLGTRIPAERREAVQRYFNRIAAHDLKDHMFAAVLMVTDEGRVTATASYPPNYLVESPPRIVLDCSDLILDALPAVIAIVMGVSTPETASVEFLNTPMRKVHYTAFEMDLGISADEAAASVRTGGGEE